MNFLSDWYFTFYRVNDRLTDLFDNNVPSIHRKHADDRQLVNKDPRGLRGTLCGEFDQVRGSVLV